MTYQFTYGARFPKEVKPQVIGATIDGLCKSSGLKNKNELAPKTVVNAARDPKSPLHPCFTWDDSKAAEKHRLEEARYLIRSIVVVTTEDKTPSKPYRAFVSVISKAPERKKVFVSLPAALADDEWREQLFENARRDFLQFKNKYSQLKQLEKWIEEGGRIFK